jgi:hypothetical protein
MSPLELRKQLLIAESELNRAQLSQEWQAMTQGVRRVTHEAKTIAAWASSAALLVAAVAALRRGPATTAAARHSWFQKVLSGVRLASMIWFALRAHGEKEKHE